MVLGLVLFLAVGAGCDGRETTAARVVDSATLTTPVRTAAVTLPHALSADDFVARGSTVRYHLHLDRPLTTDDDPASLFLPRVSSSGRMLLNGIEVGRCADGPLDRIRCVQFPWIVTPPASLWLDGDNVIEVEVFATAMQVKGLSRVFVGPRTAVAPLYVARMRTQVLPMAVFAVVLITLGLVAVVIARLLRRGPVYGWFALSCVLVGVDHVDNLIVYPGVDLATFEWFATTVRNAFAPAFLLTCFASFDRLGPRVRMAWLTLGAALPVALWFARGRPDAIQAVVLVVVVASLAGIGALVVWTLRSRQTRHLALLATLAPPVLASLHDLRMFLGGSGVEEVWLVNYSLTFTLLFLAILMLRDVAQAVQTARDLTTHLEERVAGQQRELERAYAERLRGEQQQARAREREELLRDMHDGFGSTLATARILLAQGGSVADATRVLDECRDDLRLVVDTLGNEEGRLDWALGDFRHRLGERLRGGSVAVDFDIALGDVPPMPQRTQLQLLRILQEAVTNALRHADARTITVRARWVADEHTVVAVVEDDGRDLPSPPAPGTATGRGLTNMARRAASIGATLTVEPNHPGTRVAVRWTKAPVPSSSTSTSPATHAGP